MPLREANVFFAFSYALRDASSPFSISTPDSAYVAIYRWLFVCCVVFVADNFAVFDFDDSLFEHIYYFFVVTRQDYCCTFSI